MAEKMITTRTAILDEIGFWIEQSRKGVEGNKSALARSRKHGQKLRGLLKDWRVATIEAGKGK